MNALNKQKRGNRIKIAIPDCKVQWKFIISFRHHEKKVRLITKLTVSFDITKFNGFF
jgi:hypothetical protein